MPTGSRKRRQHLDVGSYLGRKKVVNINESSNVLGSNSVRYFFYSVNCCRTFALYLHCGR